MAGTSKGQRRGGTRETYDPATANAERATTLRRNELRRKARGKGLELRHSDYGYSLIAGDRTRVEGRNDLTLDEVAARLGG